jgi:hypothetical protein
VKSECAQVELNHVMAMENATRRMESAFAESHGWAWHALCPLAMVVEYGILRVKNVNATQDSMVHIAN